ncbi:MAG: phosphotransferase, partial [Bacteroidetes bacterium]|nr:phosphotransferase [Bacteroidota bacterium]
ETSGLINAPKLLSSNLESEPFFFTDEIIFGDLLTSIHPKTPSIFRMVIPQIWRFYQSNGIDWRTLNEEGIDLKEKIQAYKSSTTGVNCHGFKLDLDRIEEFSERLIPSSLIHGDLSIKNILVTSNKNYITDWETSRRDFIIFDFLKILLEIKWELHDDIDRLMRLEIENRFGSE